jgi:hypothetical protein
VVRLLALLDEIGWTYRVPGRLRWVDRAAASSGSVPSS